MSSDQRNVGRGGAFRLGIVGCGGISVRHVDALRVLRANGFASFDLTAVCDVHEGPARHVAHRAAEWLGHEPAVYTNAGDLVNDGNVDVLDITTDAGSHHRVAIPALEQGIHVLVEKPLAVTVRAGLRMIEAAQRGKAILSVAENYRRDPVLRLVKAAIQANIIGAPRLAHVLGIAGGESIVLGTSWRHDRLRGGVLLDLLVHTADLLLYFFGDVERVYAETAILQPRRRMEPGTAGANDWLYRHRYDDVQVGEEVSATAEDVIVGVLRFANGAIGDLTFSIGSHGERLRDDVLYGSRGSIRVPPARSGYSPRADLVGVDAPLDGNALLDRVPEFRLDSLTQQLFDGVARLGNYDLPVDSVNARLVAYQLEELAQCIRAGARPEVDGDLGLRAMAVPLAFLEAGRIGQVVAMRDVLDLRVEGYQQEINDYLGID